MRKYISVMLALLSLGILTGCDLAARQLLAQFSMKVEPEEVEIPAGTSSNVTVIISPFAGISLSEVTVRLINPPIGVEAQDLTAFGGENPWTIYVGSSVEPGEYTLEAHGVSRGGTIVPPQQRVQFKLLVPGPDGTIPDNS